MLEGKDGEVDYLRKKSNEETQSDRYSHRGRQKGRKQKQNVLFIDRRLLETLLRIVLHKALNQQGLSDSFRSNDSHKVGRRISANA